MDPEIMDIAIQAFMENVHTAIPGRIVSYEGHDTRIARVRPTVRLPLPHGPMMDIPPIGGVPVVFPSTASGRLALPVAADDGVLLVFSEVGIGKWLKSVAGAVSDPDSLNRHSLTDAIAIPGLWPKDLVPQGPTIDDLKTSLSHVDGAVVELSDVISLRTENSDLRTEIEKLWTALDNLSTQLQSLATTNAVVGAPCALSPTTIASLQSLQSGWSTDKAALQKVLA